MPTNPTANTINDIISATETGIVAVVASMIVADVPWLATPILRTLLVDLLNWVCGYFAKAAENGATFVVIDLQVASEESGISSALAALIAAEKTGNQDAISQAIQVYANAQSALVADNGSSPAQ